MATNLKLPKLETPAINQHLYQLMLGSLMYAAIRCHGMTSLHVMSWYNLPSFLSHLCLCPAPSPSPSNSIQPHLPAFRLCLPASRHLCSNSEVYSCNYAMSALRLASD